MSLPSPCAVITGASRGIGAEYARALAAQGYDLLLVARDEVRLHHLAEHLQREYAVQVVVHPLDLSQPGSCERLHRLALSYRPQVSLLINNAGFGSYGRLTDIPLSTLQNMMNLHIHATMESVRLFLPDMMTYGQGAIINVASVAGFFPIPYMAAYAATKAFIISFSEGVAVEARHSGVIIQACCPGFTDTGFHETAGHRPRHVFSPQTPQEVVQTSLRKLSSGDTLVTIGWNGWASRFITRFIPQRWLMSLAAHFVRPQ